MVAWRKITSMALLSGGVLAGLSSDLPAATSSTLDILSSDREESAPASLEVGRVAPIAPLNGDAAMPLPSGNPLWSIPLSLLSATQERPVFSASRRPPQPAVVPPPVEPVSAPAPPVATGPERPALALIGTVIGDDDAVAVLFNQSNQAILRLKRGDMHAGWSVESVSRSEVILTSASRTETFAFQLPSSSYGSATRRSR